MVRRADGFRSARAATRFFRVYDEAAGNWPLPAEEIDVPTRFGMTRVRRCGSADGVPIVLLHGALGTSLSWGPLVERLGAEHPVCAVDSLGEPGRSVLSAQLVDGSANSQWLSEVLDGLGVEVAHLVGTSRGGWQALQFTMRAPERVASLTLLEPAGLAKLGWRFLVWSLFYLFTGLLPAPVRRRFGLWRSVHPEFFELVPELFRAALRYRMQVAEPAALTPSELRSISVPTRVLIAERSGMFPSATTTAAAALIPGAHVEVIPGATHMLPVSQTDLVIRHILTNIDGRRIG